MLTVFCGEDSVSAFNHYSALKSNYKNRGFQIIDLESAELEDILLWMGQSESLFFSKKAFFTSNLNKKLSRKSNLKINQIVDMLIKDEDLEVFSWEQEVSSRYLKFPKGATIKEFKPSENIFKLLDAFYPGNLKIFLSLLNNVSLSADVNFIFTMLSRQVRNLILIKNDVTDPKIQKWQYYKLKGLADKWTALNLQKTYESLYNIEVMQKTSANPFSLVASIELISCYYL